MRSAFNGPLLLMVVFVACLAGACSGDDDGMGSGANGGTGGTAGTGGSGGDNPPGTTTIGERGGVADSASGDGSVSVPSGAIASGTLDITVEQLNRDDFPDPDQRWSDVFEFGPEGADFDIPVTIGLMLDDERADSAATLWRLNETTDMWEEIALSYTTQGRVWGQVSGFSTFAAGPASAPNECTQRSTVALNTPGNVEVLVADRDQTTFVGVGTLFEQETGSVWITLDSSFTVTGLAGPPEGQGRWIDFATGPNFENGTFDIGPNGQFSIPFDIPPLGFRYLALTDACLGPFVTETNGWLYNLEVWCGPNCGQNVNAPPCQFPDTVTMQQAGAKVAADFAFIAGEQCTLGQWEGVPRVLELARDFGVLQATVIMGVDRWAILTSSEGTERVPGAQWVDLPDATEITMTLQDADDGNAPVYELRFRFDGDDLTIRSFIEL